MSTAIACVFSLLCARSQLQRLLRGAAATASERRTWIYMQWVYMQWIYMQWIGWVCRWESSCGGIAAVGEPRGPGGAVAAAFPRAEIAQRNVRAVA